MAVFVSQFHELLGITHSGNLTPEAGMLKKRDGALLRSWELDLLYRMRTVEQITLASLTLQSLSKLLGEISNIVISEEVADCVTTAVQSVEEAVEQLKVGRIKEALLAARRAHATAETAFGNPSLLALLYFPDDQKYAVYIPLFLPIMIPVLMSLKNIYKWAVPSQAHLKSD
ncbi:hypothetical protein AAG570_009012 [Ranatra chinensis]|uniref:GPI transamidase component PIG-S n=1 Tax=Ranatra chinensis TaxID=642074 RepID=A0ABD0YSI2_9HEMI